MTHFPHPKHRAIRAHNLPQTLWRLVLLVFFCSPLLPVHHAAAALGDLKASFNLPASRLAIDPIRPRIYASLTGSNSVAVIDTSTLAVIDIIPIGSNPVGLAVSPDGSKLYVANSGSTTSGIGVIDLASLQTLPSLPTPEEPSDIAVGFNGQLYLTPANDDGEGIMQVDSATGLFQEQFDGGGSVFIYGGGFLQASPNLKTLYFGNSGISAATLASFDISSGTSQLLQVNSSTVGSNGEDLRVSHSGAFLGFAVGSGNDGYQIAEIPTDNLSAFNGNFDTGAYPTNIAFSPDDAFAYTAPESQDHVLVFNTSTFLETGSFATPGDVSRMITDSSGKYLVVAGLNNYYSSNSAIYAYDTGRAAAVITSATSQSTQVGAAFNYQITATNTPTSYNATGLPAGLSVNAAGQISGTATTAGVSQVVVSASNAIGVAMANLLITVTGSVPTAALTVSVNGDGSVTSGLLGATYPTAGSSISISATAGSGYTFTGWTGAITSSSNPLTFTINSATSIQANFVSAGLGNLDATFNLPAARFVADPVRPRIYATLTGSNSVAVIDTSTLSLIQVIPIGSNPLGLAVSPDGSRLYVANSGSTTSGIGVIDLTTLTVLPSLSTPTAPSDVAVGSNGNLYAVAEVNEYGGDAIMQISTSGALESTFGDGLYLEDGAFLAISPDRNILYYGDTGNDSANLDSFDVSSGTTGVLAQTCADPGENGQDLEISHSGAFLGYAAGYGQGGYQIAEIPTNNLSATNGSFVTGAYPSNIAFSPDDAVAYAAPETQDEVRIFDTSTFTQTGSFPLPGNATRLITDSSGAYLFVAALDSSYNLLAINVYGTGRPAAVITSATSQSTELATPFTYHITAANNPTSYNATGLPPGFSVNTVTGLISGAATGAGVSHAIISASNTIGVAMANLTITVGSAQTAALTVTVDGSGTVTSSLLGTTYPIVGSSISVLATPAAGYVFTGWTGDITSTANPLDFKLEGATSIQAGFAPAPPAPPSVGSAFQSGLLYGAPFSYQIVASGAGPLTYGASGLPLGLSLDPGTGLISGTFADAGSFTVILSATNTDSGGYGAGALDLQVEARLSVAAGVGGFTVPGGVSYLSRNAAVSLQAVPVTGYLFADWTGPSTSSSNPLVLAMPAMAQWTANFVPATTYAGTYSGLLSAATPADNSSGLLAISLFRSGAFTGNVTIGGIKYPIAGNFALTNSATITIARRALPPITVNLTLDLSGATPLVTGTATDGAWTSSLSAGLSPGYPTSSPSSLAGLYTVALYSSTQSQIVPAGAGCATLTVTTAGLARLAGTLADGTPFSSSATVASDGTLSVYCPLYATKGSLTGTLAFESATNVGELTGVLNWWKPQSVGASLYPAPFSTTLNVAGSSYSRPQGLPGASGTISFTGGDLTGTLSYPFTLSPLHKVFIPLPGSKSVTFTLSPLTGLFSGQFLDALHKEPFHGVLLQQQDAAAGFFLDSGGSGVVNLTVSP